MDLISVIVPIYNVEKYLAKCLDSILGQTYKNIEVILVNDGSSDNSEAICLAYASKDNRIVYYKKENGGLSDARNFGLDKMRGKYVTFVDSDDYLAPQFLEDLYHAIKKHDAQVAMCPFHIVFEGNDNVITKSFLMLKNVVTGKEVLKEVLGKEGYVSVVAWCKLYASSCFENLRFDKGKYFEDEYINFKLFYPLTKVAIVEDALYYYVQRQNSIMNSALSRKKMSDTLEFLDNRIAFYQLNRERELEQLARIHYCHALIRILGSASKMMASQEIQSLQKKYILNFKEVDWKSMNIGVKHYGIYFLASKNLYIISKVYQIFKKS
ncbi:TPA: glycosyltransferase family 2 protein [Streptococcus suis]|nr:glycosyltransferase family 2 protein [Streptococcus suis]